MAIIIPADLTIVCLRRGDRELPQPWSAAYAVSVLRHASDLLKSRANIEFPLATCDAVVEAMPPGATADAIDEAGYDFLAAQYEAGDGIRVLLVDRATQAELGARSRRQTRVCAIAYGSDLAAISLRMAHELGHLLALPHADSDRSPRPGQERQAAAWTRNLMYSGALNRAAELTQTQVQAARSSPLARRFGGG